MEFYSTILLVFFAVSFAVIWVDYLTTSSGLLNFLKVETWPGKLATLGLCTVCISGHVFYISYLISSLLLNLVEFNLIEFVSFTFISMLITDFYTWIQNNNKMNQ